jgi:hypothetical protein
MCAVVTVIFVVCNSVRLSSYLQLRVFKCPKNLLSIRTPSIVTLSRDNIKYAIPFSILLGFSLC